MSAADQSLNEVRSDVEVSLVRVLANARDFALRERLPVVWERALLKVILDDRGWSTGDEFVMERRSGWEQWPRAVRQEFLDGQTGMAELAKRLVDSFGPEAVPSTMWHEATRPDNGMRDLVVAAAAEYLLAKASTLDPEAAAPAAAEVAEEIVNLCSSRQYAITSACVVDVDQHDAAAADGVHIRRATDLELAQLAINYDGARMSAGLPFWSLPSDGFGRAVLEVEEAQFPLDFEYRGHERLDRLLRVIAGLQLFGRKVPGVVRGVMEARPAWLPYGRWGIAIPIRCGHSKPEPVVESNELQGAVDLADRLDGLGDFGGLRLSVDRFTRALARDDPRDMLLDCVGLLEGLLVRGSTEVSLRFRLLGALLLAETPDEREIVAARLKIAYDLRSRIAHGAHVTRESAQRPLRSPRSIPEVKSPKVSAVTSQHLHGAVESLTSDTAAILRRVLLDPELLEDSRLERAIVRGTLA